MAVHYLTGETERSIRTAMFQHGLTGREREVCWRYIHGIGYQAMADEFGCSVQSVKRHLAEIKHKCGFDPSQCSANPVRLLRLLCGLAPHVPLVAA